MREHLDRGREGDLGAAPVALRPDDGQGCRRLAAVDEAHAMLVTVAPDAQVEPVGQAIDHRDANAVQAAGDLVGILIELPACVQDRHDHLGGGDSLALVDVDRDTAAIVGHRDRAVGIDCHLDPSGVAGQGLVDRVVDDLEHHVMQARAVVGVADVHARAHAHGLEPFENLDRAWNRRHCSAAAAGSFMGSERSVGDMEELAGPRQHVEQAGLGPGQPGLGAEVGEHGQQLRAAARVEMGGDFVQQQHRQVAPAAPPQPRLGRAGC